MNEKNQLSFIYQPGVGLYDKNKLNHDQDLSITSANDDADEQIQENESHLDVVKQQDSIPIREKSLSLNEILSDKNAQKELYDVDISTK